MSRAENKPTRDAPRVAGCDLRENGVVLVWIVLGPSGFSKNPAAGLGSGGGFLVVEMPPGTPTPRETLPEPVRSHFVVVGVAVHA